MSKFFSLLLFVPLLLPLNGVRAESSPDFQDPFNLEQNLQALMIEGRKTQAALNAVQAALSEVTSQVTDLSEKLDRKQRLRSLAVIGTPHEVFHKAFLSFKANQFAEASEGFADFVALYPNHKLTGSAQFYLGESYFQQHKYAPAAREFQTLLTSFEGNKHEEEAKQRLTTVANTVSDSITVTYAAPVFTSAPASVGFVDMSTISVPKVLPAQIQQLLEPHVAPPVSQGNSLPNRTTKTPTDTGADSATATVSATTLDPAILKAQTTSTRDLVIENPSFTPAPEVPEAYEAFDWQTPVRDVLLTSVTVEGKDSDPHWVRAEAVDHLPTLIRRGAGNTASGSGSEEVIPLISNNTGRLLSALSTTTLQSGAGIVFGKVAAGWSVRLAGRAERPVFLNQQNLSVSSQQMDGERYFAFLNVEPGAHLLYLVNHEGVEEGAVGVTSLEGVASYMNLTHISQIKVSGRVYDGSDSKVQTLSSVDVRVLGSVSARTQSDSSGGFSISNVLSVGDYPLYLETDSLNGYTHRYQVSPDQASSLVLYRLAVKQIQSWLSQLEGNISPESGMIVAAAPNLVSERGDGAGLIANVSSMASNPALKPEVYTLSADGSLQVSQPLDTYNSRFFSIQVPEGPVEVKVTDPHGRVAWSQIFMASPSVVNVVGPF